MKIYLIKKEKGRKYETPDICRSALGFEISYEDSGKPAGNISVSHSKGFWACCEADAPVGLDIEEAGRIIKPAVAKRLHPEEQRYLSGLEEGGREWNREFLSIWTAKEARMKLTGEGLAMGLDTFSVIDSDLNYASELTGCRVQHLESKGVVMSVCSTDASEPEIKWIKYAGISAKSAADYAADLLTLKPYSCADLKAKLASKGYRADAVDAVIENFLELGYLDDAEYARHFAETAADSGKGRLYIERKLKESGIPKELIPEESPEAAYSRALELALQIYEPQSGRAEEEKMLAKVGRRLASRGFDAGTVYKVLGKLRKS